MPIEIKDRRNGDVKAQGVTGNSILCGHCNHEILDDTTWVALDAPYYCLLHETCVALFSFDHMTRLKNSEGRQKEQRKNDDNVKLLQQMLQRPWFRNKKGTEEYTRALVEILCLHQSLRHNKILE